MEYVAIAAAVAGGIGSYTMGRAQAKLYGAQARQAELQARAQALRSRAEAINHMRNGVEVLKNVARNMATINARAAAGSIDPFSGSVQNLAMYNMGKGVADFYTTRENRQMAELNGKIIEASGSMQSAQYIAAGSMAKRQGFINMISSFGQAAYMGSQVAPYNPSTPTSPVPTGGTSAPSYSSSPGYFGYSGG